MLEDANLISTVRQGRAKLHYLNPVALEEIRERWINKFEVPRLRALSTVKKIAEEAMTDKPSFVYVTYIASTADNVWKALTDAQGHRRVLGTQQRLRLAVGIDLGAPPDRRFEHCRCSRHRSREQSSVEVGHHLG